LKYHLITSQMTLSFMMKKELVSMKGLKLRCQCLKMAYNS